MTTDQTIETTTDQSSIYSENGVQVKRNMYARNNLLHMILPLIKSLDKKNMFKRKLKGFLISKALYSLGKLNSSKYKI